MDDKDELRNALLEIFEENGFNFVDKKDFDKDLELDSFSLISILIDIENTLAILITEDRDDYDGFRSFNDFYDVIKAESKV